jgi:hypothetical protein
MGETKAASRTPMGVGWEDTVFMHSRLIEFLRSMCLGVVVTGTAFGAGAGQLLQVHLESSAQESKPVTVRAVDGDGVEVTAVGSAPGLVEIQVEPSRIWTFEAEGDSVWAPPRTMFVDPGDRRLHLDVLEASTVSGLLIAPKGESIPGEVLLTASPAPDGEARGLPSLWERRCATDADGQFECQLPTGELDLKLRAPTYPSHFRWGLALGPDGFDWGEVRLVPGAAVIVCVVNREDEPLPKATVDLVAPEGTPRRSGYSDRSRRTTTNDRGVAVFEAVDPGFWIVRASQEGMAQTVSPPIRVLARTEVSLRDPLILDEPTILSIVVSPPATPWDEAWMVGVRKAGELAQGSELAPSKPTDSDGWAHWENVPLRRVVLNVTDVYGGLWHTEEVDLATAPQPIRVRLDAIHVHGRVNEPSPVSGTLEWRTRPGKGDVRAAYASIESGGKYDVYLSADGQWLVAIRGSDGGLSETIVIEVPHPEAEEPISIDLFFPITEVSGRVVDHEGRAVAGAVVLAVPNNAAPLEEAGGVTTALTDHDGKFVIHPNPGDILLTADGPTGASATVKITAGSVASKMVEIRLPKPGVLRGRVLLGGQPAPGVTVIALPISTGSARLEPQQSDASGRFEVNLSSPAPVSLISIPSRGGAVVQIAAPGEEDVIVNLSAVSGRLEARWNVALGVRPVLRVGPTFVGLDLLVMFSPAGGGLSEPGRIVVPNLACGRYELCLPPALGQTAAPACRPVDVFPGGHTVVDMTDAE